jgi:hypothetical protein
VSSNPKFSHVSRSVQNWISATSQTPDPCVLWGCVYTFWKCFKIIYNFHVDCFPWICPSFRQLGFLKSSSVRNRLCPKTVKQIWKACHIEIQLNQKGSWPILHFWPNCSRSIVPEQILNLAPKLKSLYSFGWNMRLTLILSWYNVGFAYPNKLRKDA